VKLATKIKKKFVYIRPKSSYAKEVFEYSMLGLQSCEILQQEPTKYLLKPIKGDFSFWMKTHNDKDWEIDK